MVQISNHGGSCCGMRHIWHFRDQDQDRYIRELIRIMNRQGEADDRLQLEVILSDRQTRENPGLVDALARLGYVYTSSWTGQHGTPIHLFLRAKHRLALTSANFYNRWVNDLNGMLPHPALAGNLPAFEERAQEERQNNNRRPLYNFLLRGDRVRVNSQRSEYFGREARVEGFGAGGYDRRYTAVLDIRRPDGRRVEISVHNLERIEDAVAPAQPAAPVIRRDYRHPTNPAGWPAPAERPAAPERRLILSQFYCIFVNTGQASRVFATLEEGQNAYPRARNWQERKVYSDGEIVEGPVNHG